jgi:hypothetical protein
MKLKNIITFNKFRKAYESSIPADFSNSTGFSQSLVGRGLFSLIRYFKKGINVGRLEYLKRKLENEYFAGWLRFCALNTINIKDGTAPHPEKIIEEEEIDNAGPDDDGGGGTNTGQTYPFVCEILAMDFLKANDLNQRKTELENHKAELLQNKNEPGLSPEDLAELDELIKNIDVALHYCLVKYNINTVFNQLRQQFTSTGLTFYDGNGTNPAQPQNQVSEAKIIEWLDQILAFLKNEAKVCPSYHLTNTEAENEKKVIDLVNTATNPNIKNKCQEIVGALNESLDYEYYESINEEFVSSGINTKVPIMQILGDSLNTDSKGAASKKVNPYEYLKSIGINNVDEINFKACAELWRQYPQFRAGTTQMVSLDGVKKVQYAASRIIYRSTSVPAGHGQAQGGLNYAEDSGLRTAWERRVEKAKGEWTYFMDVNQVDPFKLMSMQEAWRKSQEGGPGRDSGEEMLQKTKNISINTYINKIGLNVFKGLWTDTNKLIVMQYEYGQRQVAYIVCMLKCKGNSSYPSVYRYLGNIQVEKIIDNKIYDQQNFRDQLKDYASSVLSDDYENKGDKNFNRYFKLDTMRQMKNRPDPIINSIVFAKTDFKRFSSNEEIKSNKTKLFTLSVNSGRLRTTVGFDQPHAGVVLQAADVKLMSFDERARNFVEVPVTTDLKTSVPVIDSSGVGCIYEFADDSWEENYFPNGLNANMKQQQQKVKTLVDLSPLIRIS